MQLSFNFVKDNGRSVSDYYQLQLVLRKVYPGQIEFPFYYNLIHSLWRTENGMGVVAGAAGKAAGALKEKGSLPCLVVVTGCNAMPG